MIHGVMDTLATARSLEEAGMDARSAAAVTGAIRRAVTEGGATKADLAELETRLRTELAERETRLRADIAELKAEVRADIAELKAEVRADTAEFKAEFKAEIHAELSTLTWRILGGVGLLLAVFTAVDRLLA